jgi:hypothetical protein
MNGEIMQSRIYERSEDFATKSSLTLTIYMVRLRIGTINSFSNAVERLV